MQDILTVNFKKLNIRKNYYVWELICNNEDILNKLQQMDEYKVNLYENETGLKYYSIDYMPKDKDWLMFNSDIIIHKNDINKLTNLIKEINTYIKNNFLNNI